MIHELRVTDKEGLPVELAPGSPVKITVDSSGSFQGRVVESDQGGVASIDFENEVYAAYMAARDSKRPGTRFRNKEVGG